MRFWLKPGYFLLIICVAVLPLFGHLNETPLQLFDEQRLANNALEMVKSGDLITTTFDNRPDYWNPKPPLMIWLQAFNFRMFGYNELSLRLPSAIAALLTCLLIAGFCSEFLKKPLLGIVAVIVLVSSPGYVMLHGTRTGDYDALLTLFLTGGGLYYFAYLQIAEKKYLSIAFVWLTLALMTKGIAVLLILPGLFVFTLFSKDLGMVLRTRRFYVGALLCVLPVTIYFILRRLADPNFFNVLWGLDVSGRFFSSLNNNPLPVSYYLKDILTRGFAYWFPLAVIGIGASFFIKNFLLRRFVVFAAIFSLCFLAIISAAGTKFLWYALPAYPFMAVLAATPVYLLQEYLQKKPFFKSPAVVRLTSVLIIVIIAFIPFGKILAQTLNPQTEDWQAENQQMGFFLQSALRGTRNIEDCKLIMDYGESNLTWYIRVMEMKGMKLKHTSQSNSWHVAPGEKIVVYSAENKDFAEKHFYTHVVEDFRTVRIYRVDSLKIQNSKFKSQNSKFKIQNSKSFPSQSTIVIGKGQNQKA